MGLADLTSNFPPPTGRALPDPSLPLQLLAIPSEAPGTFEVLVMDASYHFPKVLTYRAPSGLLLSCTRAHDRFVTDAMRSRSASNACQASCIAA